MATSANSVFHYTKQFDYLKQILEKGFYPSYCKESIHRGTFIERFAVPMVSFCDIPLANVKDHIEKYGSYSIGLSTNWAIKNKLNPVQYLQETSNLTIGINGIMWFLMQDWHELLDGKEFGEFYDRAYKGALTVLYSVKPFVGPLTIAGEEKIYKFYDEREWRYTPIISIDDATKYPDIYWEKDYAEKERLFPVKPHFKNYHLDFTAKDIKYIIVDNEDEVPALIDILEKQTRLFQNEKEFKILLTKILTVKQIIEDF